MKVFDPIKVIGFVKHLTRTHKSLVYGTISVVVIVLLLVIKGCTAKPDVIERQTSNDTPIPFEIDNESQDIYVHIAGCVLNPGVYAVPKQTRLYEIVNLAGGFKSDASVSSVNLARTVNDAEQIYVPSIDEVTMGLYVFDSEEIRGALININTADEHLLDTLPGIGPALASRIIVYRTSQGKFSVAEDLMKVSGIGAVKFEGLRNLICV